MAERDITARVLFQYRPEEGEFPPVRSEGDKSEGCPAVGVVRCCPCPLALRAQQLVQRLADTNVKNLVFGLLPELLMQWLRGDP